MRDGSPRPRLVRCATAAVVAAVALVVYRLRIGRPDAWTDEGVTFTVVQRSWGQLLRLWQGTDAPLLGYYVVAKGWTDAVSPATGGAATIGVVRGASAVAMALAAALLFLLVARHCGPVAGLAAAATVVVLPGVSRYAQEARPAALTMFLTALVWYTFDRWRAGQERGRATWWASGGVLVVALTLLSLTSLFGFLQWAALGVVALLGLGSVTREDGRRLGGVALRAVLLAPLALAAALSVWPALHVAGLGSGPASGSPVDVQQWLATLRGTLFASVPPTTLLVVVVLVLSCSALLALRDTQRRELVVLLLVWFVVPLVGYAVASLVHPPFLRVRYWMPLVLPIAGLVGVGCVELARMLRGPLKGRARSALAVVVVGGLSTVLLVGCVPGAQAVRATEGHGSFAAPAIDRAKKLERRFPGSAVMIDGVGASFYFAAPAPDLFASNMLTRLDPDSTEVWLRVYPDKERLARMRAADGVVWIHYRRSAPSATFARLDSQLRDSGLHKVRDSVEGGGQWQVTFYRR